MTQQLFYSPILGPVSSNRSRRTNFVNLMQSMGNTNDLRRKSAIRRLMKLVPGPSRIRWHSQVLSNRRKVFIIISFSKFTQDPNLLQILISFAQRFRYWWGCHYWSDELAQQWTKTTDYAIFQDTVRQGTTRICTRYVFGILLVSNRGKKREILALGILPFFSPRLDQAPRKAFYLGHLVMYKFI